jgi:hypothetical protein
MIGNEGAAPRQRLDRLHDPVVGFPPENIAAGTGINRVADFVRAVLQREDHDLGSRRFPADLARDFDAVQLRQRDVENGDVRLVQQRKFERITAVVCFRADFEILTCFEKSTQTTAHDDGAVCKQDAHHFMASCGFRQVHTLAN